MTPLWLAGSGASRTVVSVEALKAYRILRERGMREFEPKAKRKEPNHRVISQDHGFLHAANHPLPAPGDLEDAIERPHDGKEICPPSEVTRYPEFSKKVDRELSLHRRRGHIPFDSRCVHCINSRSTLHHGRVSKSSSAPVDHHMMLIQADFFKGTSSSCSSTPEPDCLELVCAVPTKTKC